MPNFASPPPPPPPPCSFVKNVFCDEDCKGHKVASEFALGENQLVYLGLSIDYAPLTPKTSLLEAERTAQFVCKAMNDIHTKLFAGFNAPNSLWAIEYSKESEERPAIVLKAEVALGMPAIPCIQSLVIAHYKRFVEFLISELAPSVMEAQRCQSAVTVRYRKKDGGDTLPVWVSSSPESMRNATMTLLDTQPALEGTRIQLPDDDFITVCMPGFVHDYAKRQNTLGRTSYEFKNAVVKDAIEQNGFIELRIAEYRSAHHLGQITVLLGNDVMSQPQLNRLMNNYRLFEAADWRGLTLEFWGRHYYKGIHSELSSSSKILIGRIKKIRKRQ